MKENRKIKKILSLRNPERRTAWNHRSDSRCAAAVRGRSLKGEKEEKWLETRKPDKQETEKLENTTKIQNMKNQLNTKWHRTEVHDSRKLDLNKTFITSRTSSHLKEKRQKLQIKIIISCWSALFVLPWIYIFLITKY